MPLGSALMHWGRDPHEIAWQFWRAGEISDEVMKIAPQPDPKLPIYLAGEAYSNCQSWAEGALESTDAVFERLTSQG